MQYINMEQAKEIHRLTILYSEGGVYSAVDLDKLESILEHIQNDEYYPTFLDKITHLFYCVCKFHCFADGNKRLAITLATQFLLINNYLEQSRNFFRLTENISFHVARGVIDKELLREILEAILNDTFEENEILLLKVLTVIE